MKNTLLHFKIVRLKYRQCLCFISNQFFKSTEVLTFQRRKTDCHINIRKFQRQPSEGVLKKKCFEIMQQIYRRTPMLKCDFNKVTLQGLFPLLIIALQLFENCFMK